MRHSYRYSLPLVAVLLCFFFPTSAGAGGFGREIWIGAGGSKPDYNDSALASMRGGAGLVVMKRLTLGGSVQVDRAHTHLFADVGLILPGLWGFEPYGRFQFGRRDDRSDDAYGWVGGILFGESEDTIKLFLEAFGIVEPEENLGISVGIRF